MKIYTIQEITHFYSPVVNKYFPRDTSSTITAFKNKQEASKFVKDLNFKKFKDICKQNQLVKYIPDAENLTKIQQDFVVNNSVIFEENYILKMKPSQIEEFMRVFNLNFYATNEIELQ